MTLFLRCDSDLGGGGRGDEPEGRSGGNVSNPQRGGGEGRKGQSDGGRAGFCLAGDVLAGKTAGGVEDGGWRMRGETRTAAFSLHGRRRDPFISLIMRRDCCFCQSPPPPGQVLIIHAHTILNISTFLPLSPSLSSSLHLHNYGGNQGYQSGEMSC